MKDQDLLLKGLGYLDRGVVLAEIPPFPYEPRGRSTEELEILDLAQRRVTVRRLGWAEGGLTFPRLRAVYALLAAGILREADAASAPQPVVQTETGMFLLSALHNRPDPSLREAIRREVQQELEHSARLDRDAWLKLARAAPRDELVRALEEKMERYHALRDGVAEDDSLRTDIDVILGRASSALRLARQAPETASADAVLARHAAEAAPPVRQAAPPPAAPAPAPAAEKPAPAARPAAPADRPMDQTRPPVQEALRPTRPTRPRPPRRLAAHRYTRRERIRGPGADRAPPHGGRGPDDRGGLRERGEGLREAGEGRAPRGRVPPPPRRRDGLLPAHLEARRARVLRGGAARARERRDPLPVGALLQGHEDQEPRGRRDAHRGPPQPQHKAARAELESLSPKDSALTSLKKLFR